MSGRGIRSAVATAVALVLAVAALGAGPDATAAGRHAHIGFHVGAPSVHPHHALFAGKRKATLRFRMRARRPADLRIVVRDVRRDRIVGAWRLHHVTPGKRVKRSWNAVTRRGKAAPDGRYEFRVGVRGRSLHFAGRFRLHGHVFPVDGAHGTRGPVGAFGAPRTGGRMHEGFDITADCGTRLVVARGGKVARVGYDPRLYGNYVLINGRKTGDSYFYAHMVAPTKLHEGEHVRTGEKVGRVGQTGNAAGTPCHLHFELHRHGRPIDPEPSLRRWDRYS